MRRFRSRRFAMLLILMLTLSMTLQGLGPVVFAEGEEQQVLQPEVSVPGDVGAPPLEEPVVNDPPIEEPQVLVPEISTIGAQDIEVLDAGSIKTTDSTGNPVNLNLGYTDKQQVYVRMSNFSNGTYYVRVIGPGSGGDNTVLGAGSFYWNNSTWGFKLWDKVHSAVLNPGFDNTTNTGDVYKVQVSSHSNYSNSKQDMFKVFNNPLVEINKSVSPTSAKPGETVTYTITVTNTGNMALTNVVVTDPMLGDLSGYTVASLAKGASITPITKNYTIPAGTPKTSFPILNTATVNTTEGATDSDGASVAYEPTAHVSLDKSVDKAAAKTGETVVYTFTILNDGEINLTNVHLLDDLFHPDMNLHVGNLAIGASYSTTRSYVIGTAFPVINTASVTTDQHVGATDTATVERMLETGVTLDKSVSPEYARPGDTVLYSFTANNIGETGLTGVAISDPMFDPDLLINIGDLASGASVTTTHSFTIPMTFTSEDFPIHNLAVVNTDQQVSARDNADLYYKTIADIDVDKTVSPTTALVGDTVTYTIIVKNTGDFTLYNVLVDDLDIPFSTTIDVLDPGASQTFNPTYVIQSGDVVDNQFKNTVNVTGNTCRGQDTIQPSTLIIECIPVSDSDDAIVSIGTTPNNPGEPGTPTTTTTTTVDRDRADPPSTSIPAEPTPLAAPVITPVTLPEEIVPLGVPVLPKTGELPVELFYGLGGMLTALGAFLKRK